MKTNQRKLVAAMSLCVAIAIPNIASAAPISGQGTWESTLQGRDLDGNITTAEAYYDTVLGITWLANGNAGAGSIYDDVAANLPGTTSDGRMSWVNANGWADSLTIGGYTNWRLPTVSPLNGSYFLTNSQVNGSTDHGQNVTGPGSLYAGSTATELPHMFFNTLGNKANCSPITSYCIHQSDHGLRNTGPFYGLFNDAYYWTATQYDSTRAWWFHTGGGDQSFVGSKALTNYAWAAHPGDIGGIVIPASPTVPIPAAAWLFGSGLLGLIGVARKKAA